MRLVSIARSALFRCIKLDARQVNTQVAVLVPVQLVLLATIVLILLSSRPLVLQVSTALQDQSNQLCVRLESLEQHLY